jgi:hypothetical protein
MAPYSEVTMAPHPEQLSCRISEIDLTSRGTKDTLPEYGPVYSRDELFNLRSEIQGDQYADTTYFKFDGVHTPPSPSHPAVPPTTPADNVPDDMEEGGGTLAQAAVEKRIKKKSGGSRKSKSGSTGFEGLC